MEKYRKILIIRPGAIGDTLMLLPSIKILTQHSQVYVAGRRPGINFLFPHTSECFDMDESAWHKLFLRSPAPTGLPPSGVNLVACFINDPKGMIWRNLRFHYPGAEIFVFPSLPEQCLKMHVAQYVAYCLQGCGAGIDSYEAIELACKSPLLVEKDQGLVRQHLMLHPGSGSRKKNYPLFFWVELIQKITLRFEDSRIKKIVLLGPAEQDIKPYFSDIASTWEWEIADIPSPEALLGLMRETEIFVGHDSGMSHLAAMVGARTIVLFKSTDPSMWRPLGPRVVVIKEGKNEEKTLARVFEQLNLNTLPAVSR